MEINDYQESKMLIKLSDELFEVEQDRLSGVKDYTLDEVDRYLSGIIEGTACIFE